MKRLLFICWLTLFAGILSAQTWTEMAEPSTLPDGACTDVDLSADGQYAIVAGVGAGPWFYRRVGNTWTEGTSSFTAATGVSRVTMSGDGNYAYCNLTSESPYIKAFRRTGDNAWTAYTFVTLTYCRDVDTDYTGTWTLYTGNATEAANTYERTGTTTWTDRGFTPGTTSVHYVAIDSLGIYGFLIRNENTVQSLFRTGTTWTTEGISGDTTPGSSAPRGCGMSYDGMYACVSTSVADAGKCSFIYLRSGSGTSSVFTYQTPAVTLDGNNGIETNNDGTLFTVSNGRDIIGRVSTTYSLLDQYAAIGTTENCALSNDGTYVATTGSVSPYVEFYLKDEISSYDRKVSGVASLASVNSVLSASIKSVNGVE